VVEGVKLVEEALDAGAAIEAAFVAPGAPKILVDRLQDKGIRTYAMAPDVLERVADAVTPQPVMAVVGYLDVELDTLRQATMVVVCVDVRDPGNAGTVLRSAEAAGADGVVFCEGSVDVYNPKTVRASAGSLFHVPFVTGGDPVKVLEESAAWGLHCLGTVASGGADYASTDLRRRVAFVLGNEAHGLPDDVADRLPERVTIPMTGRTESLNVGMAAAVLCFEASRQRRGEPT
jgi:RNA methyltransferase, TrmH family